MNPVVELNLKDPAVYQQWRDFLTARGILNFASSEVEQIDLTLGLYDEDQDLVATASVAQNIIKYVGVCSKNSVPGARFNKIISSLTSHLFQNNIFHLLVFTKPKYVVSFEHVGFKVLARTEEAVLLETGTPDIQDYLAQLPQVPVNPASKVAGIVMNANPFTWGHRYLIEQALKTHDYVYVFVVNTDASLFSTAERQELVQAGVADLGHVIVVNGGDYLVSYATFPAYFLPSSTDAITYQTTLDARIFRDLIAPACKITTRFLGSEPLSKTTGIYNQVLQKELPPQVAVEIIPRKLTAQEQYITATQVRQKIAADDLNDLATLVPETTATFIKQHCTQLQARIQKGMRINGN
ncbi:[citrate (pro-3S)-lyase] ligase [Lactobacillus sp. DCY120]|uniref:[Citrate [pro-3S]-lyase] ligase n=1 Tax=Bombilactobacillus apium TaxID=2675299 RepID=A0A850RBQ6_9LACO|nr:[citrate (pro-3S)-lyase] ligase [Bombilactobacillus apium]NVY96228.1 [citrate (pro-3S)-lyase] ligase [Bombilactobacillus apium]